MTLPPDRLRRFDRRLARLYLAGVERLCSEGPLSLLGWSFGGLIAHAIAPRPVDAPCKGWCCWKPLPWTAGGPGPSRTGPLPFGRF
ncbi:thioesterase domain-containing protein [Ponticoccus alexandrii]|uniref:thioesterase domain-containing protein n=1 Tax=Ponticoccus alexandrii TaxID=1943633 RepID=UPI003D80C5AE